MGGGGRNRWQSAKTGEGQLKRVRGSENRWGAAKTDGGQRKQVGVGTTDGRQLKQVRGS